jgi:hypothetical protein
MAVQEGGVGPGPGPVYSADFRSPGPNRGLVKPYRNHLKLIKTLLKPCNTY